MPTRGNSNPAWPFGLVYGLLRQDLPLSVANAVMVVLTGAITAMKLRFEQPPGRV